VQTYTAVPTFEEWKRQDSAAFRFLAQSKPSSVFPYDAPMEPGNLIDYLRFLGSLLEAGSTIPENVLDALQPEVAFLLLTHFAPPESLNYYSPERFRLGRA